MENYALKDLLTIYNECYGSDITPEDFKKELKDKKIKEVKEDLTEYLSEKIENELTDLAQLTGDFPVELRQKRNSIKSGICFTYNQLNKYIKKLNNFYLEVSNLVRGIKYSKYNNKLEELKTTVTDEDVLRVINKELLKLNTNMTEQKELNETYYDQLITNINNPNSDLYHVTYVKETPTKYSDGSVAKQFSTYKGNLENPLKYFDDKKLEVARLGLEEDKEKEILNYIDELKEEYKYLFTTTMDPNNKRDIVKMFMSLDSLVNEKLGSDEKSSSKTA